MSDAREHAFANQHDSATTCASPVGALPRRDLLTILACITLITALAWLYLIHLDRQMSGPAAQMDMMMKMGMSANMSMKMSWTAADVVFTFAMWAVMMVGMMAPSAAPMILVYAGAQSRRAVRSATLSTGLFALGYVVIWTAFSWLAALAQWGLHEAALMSESMTVTSPRIGGAVLIAAGLYQFTPWKRNCLTCCRSPLNFLMARWREDKMGAFWMGTNHGMSCLGCCWALMCVLFAVGVMNLAWVAALAAVALVEKIAPKGVWIARISGAALVAYGIALLA